MTHRRLGLADIIDGDPSRRWNGGREKLPKFLRSVGLIGNECSQSLYIFPKRVLNPTQYGNQLHALVGEEEPWAFLTGTLGDEPTVIAFPASKKVRAGGSKTISPKAVMALFVEVHSRLVSWWLVNAWRSQQLADATWHLGDSMQIIAAAACARSLLGTASSFWIETNNLRELWDGTKRNFVENGPNVQHWHDLTVQLYKMVWAAKFDRRAPELEKAYEKWPRLNVLTQVEKLARVTAYPVQEDYQWLCNTVHPSIGGMLTFAAPSMAHVTRTHLFQWVCAVPIAVEKINGGNVVREIKSISSTELSKSESRETTIQEALARAATFAVDVLEKTLDDALRIIDDIGLTTKAPQMASFDYWRNITRKQGNTLCPCRSGRKAKHCLHQWADPTPPVVGRF